MGTLQILIILTTLSWSLEAKPNQCCSNNSVIIPRKGCSDNSTMWTKTNCNKVYAIYPSDRDVEISEDDDTLIMSDVAVIPRNKYCVGSRETVNNSIILICFPEPKRGMSSNEIARTVCMAVSILSLFVTLGVYLILPRLRDLHGKCIMSTVLSLLVAFTLLGVVQNKRDFTNTACYLIATAMYFWFFSAFFWMNIVAFHIWRCIANPSYPKNKTKTFWIYNGYGWGGPTVILIIAKICYHVPGNHIKPWTLRSCWFSDYNSLMVYFHIPITILLAANVIMFILCAWSLRKTNTSINNNLRSRQYKFLLCLKLFLVMGICWIFEPVSGFLQYEFLSNIWLVTDYINGLQGLIIFLLLVVFRKRVRRDLARHKGICCQKLPQDWATIPDEDCEELTSEESEKLTAANEINEIS